MHTPTAAIRHACFALAQRKASLAFSGRLAWGLVFAAIAADSSLAQQAALPETQVRRCEDFEVSGKGEAAAWNEAPWVAMNARPGNPSPYSTRFKLLYSPKGIYVLFDGEDKRLSASFKEDFSDLWKEDVFECFFWSDERDPVYFEYEISPLGYELPILIPNFDGQFLGWRPWRYEGSRKTRKAVSITGGRQESQAEIAGWRAEVFLPYELLAPLRNVPPRSGARWRANFYRMDYDQPTAAAWDWARVGASFHEFQKFGVLVFE